MKQKIKQISLGISLVAIIGFGAIVIGVIPPPHFLDGIKPFSSVLIAADEDYLDVPCTPELCGEDQIDDQAEAEIEAEEQAAEQKSQSTNSATSTPTQTQQQPKQETTQTQSEQQTQQNRTQPIQNRPVNTPPVTQPSSQPIPTSNSNPAAENGNTENGSTTNADAETSTETSRGAETNAETNDEAKNENGALTNTETGTDTSAETETGTEAGTAPDSESNASSETTTNTLSDQLGINTDEQSQRENQIQKLEEIQRVVENNDAFSELLGESEVQKIAEEIQTLRTNEPIGISAPTSPEEQRAQSEQTKQRIERVTQELEQTGADERTMEQAVRTERRRINAEHTREQIRRASRDRFNLEIRDSNQDTDGNSFSDEVEILMGSDGEKTLFGVNDDENTTADRRAITTGLRNGSRLASGGCTVLGSGPRGERLNLVAVDTNGQEYILGEETVSENNLVVLTCERQLPAGYYAMQVRRASNGTRAGSAGDRAESGPAQYGAASVIATTARTKNTAKNPDASKAVIVEVSEEDPFEKPVVKNIQNIDVAGLRDIKVSTDKNGKIKVTGSADIDAVVVGTFQSAVFTSAILADVNTGLFEITSASSLEVGDHEVTIFSTNPANGAQSEPARVRFKIIETAMAADGTSDSHIPTAEELENNTAQLIGISLVAGIALLIIVGFLIHKKRSSTHPEN